ncbi:unnamed protein product [Ectocarpus sp. 6 AP-2014]
MAEHAGGGDDDVEELREQDRFLPIANISRLVKKRLPYNAKVAKDAKETTQECVSEFICWITADASDKCQDEKRKTISGEDIITSMNTLGFDDYIEPLKVYLAKYRAAVKGDRNANNMMDTGGGGGGGAAAGGRGGYQDDHAPPSGSMAPSYRGGASGGGGGGGGGGWAGGGAAGGFDMDDDF